MKEIIELSIILLLLIFSFIYSGSEVSIFSISEIEKVKLTRNKSRKNILLLKYLNHPERTLIVILIGNMVVNLSASIIGEQLSHTFFVNNPLFYSVLIMTSLVLLFGEILPKNIAALKPIVFAKRFLNILEITRRLFNPLIIIFTKLIKRSKSYKEHSHLSKEELISAVEVSSQAGLDKISIKILKNLLGLIDRPVTDIMVPRADINAIDIENSWINIERLIEEYIHSAVIFYSESIDNIIGYVSKIDLIHVRKKDIFSNLREPLYIPESKTILPLLSEFKDHNNYIAVILDEYGGTVGLVTLKDVLDSIFIRDVLISKFIQKKEKNIWHIHGNTKIFDLNSTIDLNLPTELNTISGYIVNMVGSVPRKGFRLKLSKNITVSIKESSSKQIELLELRRIDG